MERKEAELFEERERAADAARKSEEEAGRRLSEVEERHRALRGEHAARAGELAKAQTMVQELEAAIKVVEASSRELTVVVGEKERLLRDQRGEAELDRAVLEKELEDLRGTIKRREGEVELGAARASTLEEVAEGLRVQIARWEKMAAEKDGLVGSAREEVERARREKEVGIVEVRRELVKVEKIARSALKVAGDFKEQNGQIIAMVIASPMPNKSDSSTDHIDSTTDTASHPPAPAPVHAAPSPPILNYEQDDLEELLAEIQQYNADPLADAVKTKVENLTQATKKWIKEAKSYRERAHRSASTASDKIAFRK